MISDNHEVGKGKVRFTALEVYPGLDCEAILPLVLRFYYWRSLIKSRSLEEYVDHFKLVDVGSLLVLRYFMSDISGILVSDPGEGCQGRIRVVLDTS